MKKNKTKILWKTYLRKLTEIVKMPWRDCKYWNQNSSFFSTLTLNTKILSWQERKYSLKHSLYSRTYATKNPLSKIYKMRKRKFKMQSQSFSFNIASTCRLSISIWFFIASKKKTRKGSLSSSSDAWLYTSTYLIFHQEDLFQ